MCTALECLGDRSTIKNFKDSEFKDRYLKIRDEIIKVIEENKKNIEPVKLDDILEEQLKGFYRKYVSSANFLNKQQYNQIKKLILETLTQEKETIKDDNLDEQYDKFIEKMKNLLNDEGNRISTFEEKLREMFLYYGVKYTDLFDSIKAIIKVRNNLVHKGSSFNDINCKNLQSLFIRTVLYILEYEGDYIQHKRSDFQGARGETKYTRQHLNFPNDL